MTDEQHGAPSDVSPDLVMETLADILASNAFHSSQRSRDFLAFVVTETLAGRSDRLKERTVARGALSRSSDFDVRSDSAVRVYAGRVRAALNAYYTSSGPDSAVRIDLPKGTYVPTFAFVATSPPVPSGRSRSPVNTGPAVAVVQFTASGAEPTSMALATGVTEALVRAIARFPAVRVVGPISRNEPDPGSGEERRLGSRLDVQYLLRGHVEVDGATIRVTARLVDAETGEVVWAESLDRESRSSAMFDVTDDVADHLAAVIGDYSGIVVHHAARTWVPTSDPIVAEALLLFYEGLEVNSADAGLLAHEALKKAILIEPDNPLVLAMLASTEAFSALHSTDDEERIAAANRSERYARAALALDPLSAHAHLPLGTVALIRGQTELARLQFEQALALAPGNPTILYGAGWELAIAGDWAQGVAHVRESTRLNPSRPALRYLLLAADGLMARDYSSALVDATRYGQQGDFWGPLLRALALDGLGHPGQAQGEMAEALRHDSGLRESVAHWPELPAEARAVLVQGIDRVLLTTDP